MTGINYGLVTMDQSFDRSNPFYAKVVERYSLCKEGSAKEILHLVVDIKGSGMRYQVGDCLAIIPSNHPERVKRLLKMLELSESSNVIDSRTKKTETAWELLSKQVNINDCSQSLLKKLLSSTSNPSQIDLLQEVLSEKERVKNLDLIEFLEIYGKIPLSTQEFVDCLRPMMPRFYSIASSMNAVGEEVHLTVALDQCVIDGKKRVGVCTDYLCRQVVPHRSDVPVYIHPNRGFTLPRSENTPLIMVGPGTGIAPFRGFMQERELSAKHSYHWLFFGDWNRNQHFYYQDYWESLEAMGLLRLDLAFSRDQEHKIYVQDRMHEKGQELFQWLERGAHFYVCGNASKMAKDVDLALHRILEKHGNMSADEAKAYVKRMRAEKRYLRDVY